MLWHRGKNERPSSQLALHLLEFSHTETWWIFENHKFYRYSLHKQSFSRALVCRSVGVFAYSGMYFALLWVPCWGESSLHATYVWVEHTFHGISLLRNTFTEPGIPRIWEIFLVRLAYEMRALQMCTCVAIRLVKYVFATSTLGSGGYINVCHTVPGGFMTLIRPTRVDPTEQAKKLFPQWALPGHHN